MSLAIDTNHVTHVLLGGMWHPVDDDKNGISTFDLDSYEFIRSNEKTGKDLIEHLEGQAGICRKGYAFTYRGEVYTGPLTAIQGLRSRPYSGG